VLLTESICLKLVIICIVGLWGS